MTQHIEATATQIIFGRGTITPAATSTSAPALVSKLSGNTPWG
ncbi:hypothetical protein AB0O34_28830 [Sphaerisporangium sp. NPDC088356]